MKNAVLIVLLSSLGWAGSFDGPAELPRTTPLVSLASTPAPGPTIQSTGDLQTDLDAATCGEVLVLPAGSVYTGNFVMPAKHCDNEHYIWIETNGAIPLPGSRINPSYAGVASLPGRPAFTGPNKNVMAKIVTPNSSAALSLVGGDHVRLMGVEVTKVAGNYSGGLISANQSNSIIVDRDWLHGTSKDDLAVAVGVVDANNFALINSYTSDLHCESKAGTCVEAHVVSGGTGNAASAGLLIQNNFLESSSASVSMGGGQATTTPTDITISNNHFFKPLTWFVGNPGFVSGPHGDPFVIKNHLELKNAQRVLVQYSILENNIDQSDQRGYSFLFTAKNQNGLCPICQVTDVTMRWSQIMHVGGGFEVGNAESDTGALPLAGKNFSIHDLEFDDIETALGDGNLWVLGDGPKSKIPPLTNVSVSHVTGYPVNTTWVAGGKTPGNMSGLTVVNNLIQEGENEVASEGGTGDCASEFITPADIINACWTSYSVTSNGLVNGKLTWPNGNFFPVSITAGRAIIGNDGKPLGVDPVALANYLTGVE